METVVSRTLSVHKEHEVLLKLEAAGLTDHLAQRVIDSRGNDLATKVVRLIQNGGFKATTSQGRAREIMGPNLFGIEEAIKYFGVSPTQADLSLLAEIPFAESELRGCKDTHVLVAVFPLSLLDIYSNKASHGLLYPRQCGYEPFEKAKGEASWQLIRKTVVPNSTFSTWDEQRALLGKNEETPAVCVMVYTILGCFLATGERLFQSIYVRCSDVASSGSQVHVGYFDSDGLGVGIYWDNYRCEVVGVASARKPA